MFTLDNLTLLLTGLTALYLIWRFWGRYQSGKALYDVYYMMGFAVLFVSGVLLIFLGYGILGTPLVLTVASLIPLSISMGVLEQYYPAWKTPIKWILAVGIVAIAITAFAGLADLRRLAVPLFHGVAGLVIFLGPFFAKKAGKGFYWVGIGGALIGIGGLALASLSFGAPLLGIFTKDLVMTILAPLLLLMTLAFTFGFVKDIRK